MHCWEKCHSCHTLLQEAQGTTPCHTKLFNDAWMPLMSVEKMRQTSPCIGMPTTATDAGHIEHAHTVLECTCSILCTDTAAEVGISSVSACHILTECIRMWKICANCLANVFWAVTQCNISVGYQHFGAPCCLHLQGEMKMEAARSSQTFVSYHNITWYHVAEDLDLKVSLFSRTMQNPTTVLMCKACCRLGIGRCYHTLIHWTYPYEITFCFLVSRSHFWDADLNWRCHQ